MSDTFRHQEAVERMISKLSSIITTDTSYWQLDLKFYFFDEVDENLRCFGFESEEENPCEACEVIYYNQYVLFVMETGYG